MFTETTNESVEREKILKNQRSILTQMMDLRENKLYSANNSMRRYIDRMQEAYEIKLAEEREVFNQKIETLNAKITQLSDLLESFLNQS